MKYDLSGLQPEEMQALKDAMSEYDHPDRAADEAMLEPYKQAIEALAQRCEDLSTQLQSLSDRFESHQNFIMNDFFGGLEKLRDDNERHDGIESLKAKYSDDFAPHMKAIGHLLPEGADIFGQLFDHLKSHWDDEGFDPDDEVDQIIDELEQKLEELKESLSGGSEEEPEEEEIEEGPGTIDLDEIRAAAKRTPLAGEGKK